MQISFTEKEITKNEGDSRLKIIYIGRTKECKTFFQIKRELTFMAQMVRIPGNMIQDVSLEPSSAGIKRVVL